ncbi:hypothetical protein GRJ22_15175 [Photobacterium carnosum]|uniref:hypothetical protein n=1 Tax=Photobacterium carnosum TaxID=2023717 RepID=UPI001E302FF4|nr:hypothetical protein [Photobacterium carnosum]MCD9557753.1 hypothetical protein [Photobacterium carnosum]
MSISFKDFCLNIENGVREINVKAEAGGFFHGSPRYVMLVDYLRPIYHELTSPEKKKFVEDVFLSSRKDIGIFSDGNDASDLIRVISDAEQEERKLAALNAKLEFNEVR